MQGDYLPALKKLLSIALINIDAIKQKEIRANETLESINSVAQTVPLPLAVVNYEFKFQSANHSFYKYFHLSEDAVGAVGNEIFPTLKMQGDYLPALKKLLSKAMKENIPFTDFEIECEIPTIGFRILLLSAGKIHWTGAEQLAALLSFVDVTEQRHLEEERQNLLTREQASRNQADLANRTKDVFLATLSHELRTPLSSILTWSQLISEGKVDFEKAKQGAAVIEQSAKTQSRLIDDLLD
jgi:two-component system CheB/CheR fusion protein